MYTTRHGSDTDCIRSYRDQAQAVYDPRGSVLAVYDSIGARYMLYTRQWGADTDCMRSYRAPTHIIYDPVGVRS